MLIFILGLIVGLFIGVLATAAIGWRDFERREDRRQRERERAADEDFARAEEAYADDQLISEGRRAATRASETDKRRA